MKELVEGRELVFEPRVEFLRRDEVPPIHVIYEADGGVLHSLQPFEGIVAGCVQRDGWVGEVGQHQCFDQVGLGMGFGPLESPHGVEGCLSLVGLHFGLFTNKVVGGEVQAKESRNAVRRKLVFIPIDDYQRRLCAADGNDP